MSFEKIIEPQVTNISSLLKSLPVTYAQWQRCPEAYTRQKTVATTESITAGLVAYALTSVAGSSDYFKQGWVLYQERSKRVFFEMPEEIEVYSSACAKYLARNAREKAGADWGIGITGEVNGTNWIAISKLGFCTYIELPVSAKQTDTDWMIANGNSHYANLMDREVVRQWLAYRAVRFFEEILTKHGFY